MSPNSKANDFAIAKNVFAVQRVPRSVVIAAGLLSNVTITLQDPAGRSQSVKLTECQGVDCVCSRVGLNVARRTRFHLETPSLLR